MLKEQKFDTAQAVVMTNLLVRQAKATQKLVDARVSKLDALGDTRSS